MSSTLEQVFNESPSFMALTVGPNHVFQLANQLYYEVLHLQPSIVGRSVSEVFPEIVPQGFLERLDEVFRTGKTFRMHEAPLRLREADGSDRLLYVSFAYQPVRNSEGQIYGLIHQGYEVTETVESRKVLEQRKSEIEIERANFRNLFKQTPEMVCITRGPEHTFEFVNEAHVRALGFDATGMTVRQAQPESVEVHGLLDEVYRTGKTAQLHEIPVTVTDRLRYFNLTYAARHDRSGAIDGVMILGIEVTGQVHLRQALENSAQGLEQAVRDRTSALSESQAFLDSMIENLPNMVFVKDAVNLRFVRFNRAGEELLGYSRADLIGKSDYDFFPKEEADHFVAKDRLVLSGRSIVDIPEENIQTRLKGRRVLHTRKIPIFGGDGRPEYLLGISEDITEVKRAEVERIKVTREQAAIEERRRENQRASFLAEASTVLASSLDYHETLSKLARLAVPGLAEWCTVTIVREDRTKERVAAIHHDPGRAGLIDELNKYYPASADEDVGICEVIRTGKATFAPVVTEDQLRGAVRDERHLRILRELGCCSCIVVPVTARGETFGAIAFVSGIQGRVYNENDLAMAEELGRRAGNAIDNAFLYEAAQKAIHARDEFLSIASHELKTPLTSLKLQAQLRARDLKRGEFKRFTRERLPLLIADDEKQINRLTRLVDDMLDVSRVATGKMSYMHEEFDLNDLVHDVVRRLSVQIDASQSHVTFESESPAPGNWDRFRIEQVVVNLLTNALKYGSCKPIVLRVSSMGGKALLSVSDQGIGIAQEDQARIFGQFERATNETAISGLGLGLYISKKIVEAHEGSIEVRSEPGNGATFTMMLPLKGTSVGLRKGEVGRAAIRTEDTA